MRVDMRWVFPIVAYALAMGIYWCFGGNFERGTNFGMAVLFGTLFAAGAFVGGCVYEEHKLRHTLDKYRQ